MKDNSFWSDNIVVNSKNSNCIDFCAEAVSWCFLVLIFFFWSSSNKSMYNHA